MFYNFEDGLLKLNARENFMKIEYNSKKTMKVGRNIKN